MSYYTWTYVAIDKLTPEQINGIIENAKEICKCSAFFDYCNKSWEESLNEWLDFHQKEYKYFIDECGYPAEKLTEKYLTNELKRKLKDFKYRLECYDKVISGELSFFDMLKKTKQLKTPKEIKFVRTKNRYYIRLKDEIFRNNVWSEKLFMTVEELIKYCREGKNKQFYIIKDGKASDYDYWNPQFEEYIKNYYTNIGDYNFCVQFG